MAEFYVPQLDPRPPDDLALATDIARIVLGVTGLPPGLVRPRWQRKAPNFPPFDVTWCSVGVVRTSVDDYPENRQEDLVLRQVVHSTVEALVTCYGPGAGEVASTLRSGLMLGLNQAAINELGLAVVGVEGTTTLDEEVNSEFLRRVDLPVTFRRSVVFDYETRSILRADGTIIGSVDVTWSVPD